MLYNIDAKRRTLVTQNPPNDGHLNVVRELFNLDLSNVLGFDISPNTGGAYAVLRLAGKNSSMYYQIHLDTGDYNPLGEVSVFEQLSGLAIQPN